MAESDCEEGCAHCDTVRLFLDYTDGNSLSVLETYSDMVEALAEIIQNADPLAKVAMLVILREIIGALPVEEEMDERMLADPPTGSIN